MSGGRFERGGRLEFHGALPDWLRWDPADRSGALVRDRMGRQGLFVCERGDTLLFADEIGELLRMLPARPQPSPLAVAHYLSNTGIPAPHTLYEGIESVAPGELMELSPGGWRRRRWWWPEPPADTDGAAPEDVLRSDMENAIGRVLDGAGRAAVLLSGGFDSGAVAVLAARRARDRGEDPPPTYSGVFPEHPEVDESRRIAATREAAGLTGVDESNRGGRSALAAAAEFVLAWEVPPVSPNGFLWRPLIRRAAADGFDTLVDGEGGDEMFGFSPYLIADMVRRGRLLHARSLAKRIPGMGDEPKPRWVARALRRYGLRGALPAGLHAAMRRVRGSDAARTNPLLRQDLAALHTESDDLWAWKRHPGPRWRAALTHKIVLGAERLGANDYFRREAALCGIEFGQPFRDPALLEAILTLDPELMFDPHLDRPLARRALAGLLPDDVRLDDRKPHFNVLLDDALTGVDAGTLRDLLGPGARCREFLELPDGFWELDRAGGPAGGIRLFRVAALELWLRAGDDELQEIAGRGV